MSARRNQVGPRRHVQHHAARRRADPYPVAPALRAARILLAPEQTQALLRRIQFASQLGTVLEWSHDAMDLRPWRWPVHGPAAGARMGAYVAASGLRVHLAENGLSRPVCLHGRSGFLTREEAEAQLVTETQNGKKAFKFVCPHQFEEDDCYYEVYLETTPAVAVHNAVFNPGFQFQAPPEHLYLHVDPDSDDEPEVMGLSSFNLKCPNMPASVPNTATRVETRALMSLNSAQGLHIDYLPNLHRLLQHCQYCDVVALPAAMRAHVRTGVCRRFGLEAEQEVEEVL